MHVACSELLNVAGCAPVVPWCLLWDYTHTREQHSKDGPNLICCTMQSTVYSFSSPFSIFVKLRLLDGNVGTSKVEFACGLVRV